MPRHVTYSKTKVEIRFTVTAKLISAFGFATRILLFQFLNPCTARFVSNLFRKHIVGFPMMWHIYCSAELHIIAYEPPRGKKQQSAYAKTKTQISFAVTAKLISAFVFATRIVQFLFYLTSKFQASSFLL